MQNRKEKITQVITIVVSVVCIVLGIGNFALYGYALGFLFNAKLGINGFLAVLGYFAFNILILGIVTAILDWSTRRD